MWQLLKIFLLQRIYQYTTIWFYYLHKYKYSKINNITFWTHIHNKNKVSVTFVCTVHWFMLVKEHILVQSSQLSSASSFVLSVEGVKIMSLLCVSEGKSMINDIPSSVLVVTIYHTLCKMFCTTKGK